MIKKIYAGILLVMAWLTNVWLLRNILADHKIKVRDALYNAGAPILPTFMVAILFIVQLIPIALAMVGYGAASTTGLLSGGVEAMMFWIAAGLFAVLFLFPLNMNQKHPTRIIFQVLLPSAIYMSCAHK